MSVFSATEIVPVMYHCGDRVKDLSKFLFDDRQEEMKKKYREDCDKYNVDAINEAIEDAFCRLLHSPSLMKGLREFVRKFPELDIDADGEIFEKNIIRKLAQHSDEMLRIIDKNS